MLIRGHHDYKRPDSIDSRVRRRFWPDHKCIKGLPTGTHRNVNPCTGGVGNRSSRRIMKERVSLAAAWIAVAVDGHITVNPPIDLPGIALLVKKLALD